MRGFGGALKSLYSFVKSWPSHILAPPQQPELSHHHPTASPQHTNSLGFSTLFPRCSQRISQLNQELGGQSRGSHHFHHQSDSSSLLELASSSPSSSVPVSIGSSLLVLLPPTLLLG